MSPDDIAVLFDDIGAMLFDGTGGVLSADIGVFKFR